MTDDLTKLAALWLGAKEFEREATEERRAIEDRMRSLIGVADNLDGTETAVPNGYVIKITGRIDRKVDGDKLQELAAEHGLTEHLSSLFRWKPELNLSAWKASNSTITTPLATAITVKPGRPSFSITQSKE